MKAALKKVMAFDFTARYAVKPTPPDIPVPTGDATGLALLITDDRESQRWASRWLAQAGLAVKVCADADEALSVADRTTPRAVIVDATVKTQSGQLAMDAFRHRVADDLPVIALCASADESAIAANSDATDIIRQPYDWNVITRRTRRAIDMHEMMAELRSAKANLKSVHQTVRSVERDRQRLESTDKITQLPNAMRFRQLLSRATAGSRSGSAELALLVIGLDSFWLVNDAVGYENANRLLASFAERLRQTLTDPRVVGGTDRRSITAMAARLDGPRFAMLISGGDAEQIALAREALHEQLIEPFEIGGQTIYVTASLGAAVYPRDCSTADELLYHAESAMFDAQDTGSGFKLHESKTESTRRKSLELDSMLREAVKNGDLRVAFQPITDTRSGHVVAAEALLRWEHPEEGYISPGEFVPVAERTGQMVEIGQFVIDAACAQLRLWLDAGAQDIRVAVNLSLCQLLRGNIVDVVRGALDSHSIDPSLLELELSERGVLNKRVEVIDQVHALKALGVRISIDDFGTGQAAIAYLKDLPIDVIKIDRSYVHGHNKSGRNETIAASMVALAHGLNATVITEGVESEEQLCKVKDWGSQEYQGFLCSPAVSGEEFTARFARCPDKH